MIRNDAKERGGVLVIVLLTSLLIGGAAYGFLMTVISEGEAQRARTERMKAMYIAEAAASDAVVNVVPGMGASSTAQLGSVSNPVPFGGGAYWATVTAEADRTHTVVSRAAYGRSTISVETRWGREFHPVRDYAIFSGNRTETANTLALGGTGMEADQIEGKIYVHGDLRLDGDSELQGRAVATGSITGNPVDGTVLANAPKIPPPDLTAMNYDQTADFKIDASAPFNSYGRLPSSDPRHIFVRNFRTDLAPRGFRFSNPQYFLGDPYESSGLSRISVPEAGNEKVYFVDGNLWIEPDGQTQRLVNGPLDGTRITVVVRGNIYFCDELQYQDPDKDGILFIAMTDGESYRDMDGDNQYDVGEPILHDDGDGVYEGPVEGSGNVFFGDPNGGPVGNVHGYMYADNYFQDHVLDGGNGDPLPFEVTGFMSAGEQVQIRRDFGGDHARMNVRFDSRVVDGVITMPGFPEKESQGEIGLLSWRILGP